MVEAAGIEPASEELTGAVSTGLVFLLFSHLGERRKTGFPVGQAQVLTIGLEPPPVTDPIASPLSYALPEAADGASGGRLPSSGSECEVVFRSYCLSPCFFTRVQSIPRPATTQGTDPVETVSPPHG